LRKKNKKILSRIERERTRDYAIVSLMYAVGIFCIHVSEVRDWKLGKRKNCLGVEFMNEAHVIVLNEVSVYGNSSSSPLIFVCKL
jgi:hypothetical protein